MSMAIGMYQSTGLSQQLNLAPQLLQWLRLLQVPTAELSAMVQQELETNPAIEVDKERNSKADAAGDEDACLPGEEGGQELEEANAENDQSARLDLLAELDEEWRADYYEGRRLSGTSIRDEQEKHQFIMDCLVAGATLQEHLLRQIPACGFGACEQALSELIIGSLDDRGYLTSALDELAGMAGVPAAAAASVLEKIQRMEPSGVAARDLRECLTIQLRHLGRESSLAHTLVRDHLARVADKLYSELAMLLHVTEEAIRGAVADIATLNPSPGSSFTAHPIEYINPDIAIVRQDGQYLVELNDDFIPHLRLSESCRALLGDKGMKPEDRSYIRRKIRAASFLIQGIGQRQETLRKVALEIVRVQGEFFDSPAGELKPLTMVKVAGMLGVHETTVSRAIANKYMDTPRGMFDMKHFFRAGYQCSDGSALTPDAVKDLISKLIENENPACPVTDLHIAKVLEKQGLKLARRTAAKYRDELGLPSSKDRAGLGHARQAVLQFAPPAPKTEEEEPVACVM